MLHVYGEQDDRILGTHATKKLDGYVTKKTGWLYNIE